MQVWKADCKYDLRETKWRENGSVDPSHLVPLHLSVGYIQKSQILVSRKKKSGLNITYEKFSYSSSFLYPPIFDVFNNSVVHDLSFFTW